MAGTRSFAGGSFFFNLDGVKCGFVKAVDGGGVSADVIEEKPDGPFVKKHIGAPKYEDFELTIGFTLAQLVYDWMAATLDHKSGRKDGSIVAADFNLQARSERQFFNALVTEIGFPALDGASKDAAYLTLKFSPEITREVKASGKVTTGKLPVQKQFLPSNFRFELDKVDCTKVARIDAFTVKQTLVGDDIGRVREKGTAKLELPNLRVTIAEAGAADWFSWFEDFVIKGNNGDAQEKSGAIVFLTPNRQDELARIELQNVGIFALQHEAATSAADKIQRVIADLYCERMVLKVGKPVS